MNTYVELCRTKLKDIIEGRCTYESHKEHILHDICNRLKEAQEIIVCGMSPLGRACVEYVGNYTDAPVRIMDLRNSELSTMSARISGGVKKPSVEISTYIICSREEALHYLDVIPKRHSKVISYNEMIFLDEIFGEQKSLLHNQKYVAGIMENVFSHAKEYQDMMRDLGDNFSKELLSRWLLYRLYFDIEIMRGIKEGGDSYFDPEMIQPNENEVFLDAGGYDGDSLSDFKIFCKDRFQEYYFFEPEPSVYPESVKLK